MKPYTEVYDRWSFMNPDLPNPAVGGYRGAVQFAGNGQNSCNCRTPIETYYGRHRAAARRRLQPQRPPRCFAASYGINYSRRGAVGGRAGARNGTGTLGFSANASFPSPNGFDPSYNWNNGVPAYPPPPFFDPTLNAGFVTGRGTGGSVTFGDAEIGGRPPRYQNWNAGFQRALTKLIDGRGVLRRQPRRLPRRRGPRVLLEPARSAVSSFWATCSRSRRRLPISPRRKPSCRASLCRTPTSRAPSRRCCGPSHSTLASPTSTDNVAWSTYDSLQLTLEKRRTDDGLDA